MQPVGKLDVPGTAGHPRKMKSLHTQPCPCTFHPCLTGHVQALGSAPCPPSGVIPVSVIPVSVLYACLLYVRR